MILQGITKVLIEEEIVFMVGIGDDVDLFDFLTLGVTDVVVLGAGNAPQATGIAAGAVIVGNADGLTVMVLDWVIVLPKESVKVHDSVTVPPQAPGRGLLNVEVTEPLIKHVAPLV